MSTINPTEEQIARLHDVAQEIAQHLGDEFVGRVQFDIYKGGGTVSVTIGLGQLPRGPRTRVHDMLMVERRQRKSASYDRLRRRAP